jgi:hypothetical protein
MALPLLARLLGGETHKCFRAPRLAATPFASLLKNGTNLVLYFSDFF